jgi:hypothetical protein
MVLFSRRFFSDQPGKIGDFLLFQPHDQACLSIKDSRSTIETDVRCSLVRTSPVIQSEQLLQALSQCDDQLDRWLSKSQANAVLLIEDPMAAMHAAAADLDQDVMLELEAVLSGLARKLDMPISPLPNSAFRRPS